MYLHFQTWEVSEDTWRCLLGGGQGPSLTDRKEAVDLGSFGSVPWCWLLPGQQLWDISLVSTWTCKRGIWRPRACLLCSLEEETTKVPESRVKRPYRTG